MHKILKVVAILGSSMSLALAGGSSAQAASAGPGFTGCPSVRVGGQIMGACYEVTYFPESETTVALQVTACPYGSFVPPSLNCAFNDRILYRTGVEVGAAAMPTIDATTLTVSSTGGVLLTLYVNGLAIPVDVPPLCVSGTRPC